MAQTRKTSSANAFREKLDSELVSMNDHKVDDLRKIASEFGISSSHDLKKDELVAAINKARENHPLK